MIFSTTEMQGRVDRLQTIMAAQGVDVVITSSYHSNLYYAGFWMLPMGRFNFTIIPVNGPAEIIAPVMEQERVPIYSWIDDAHFYTDAGTSLAGLIDLAKNLLAERGYSIDRVGIEKDVMPVCVLEALQGAFPSSDLIDISATLMEQRVVKSKEEVDLLRKNADIANIGTETIMAAMAEGKSELEISNEALLATDRALMERFPDLESFGTIVTCASGRRSSIPHAVSTGKKLEHGEIVTFNVLSQANGYYVSPERTLSVGPVREDARRPFETMVESQARGLEAVKPGASCGDVARRCIEVLEREGYDQDQLHGPGHSCGIMGAFWGREEKGEIRAYNDNVLEPGMVITVEPAIYLPGVGGFRHCDVVAVTEDGYEMLTHYDRGILEI
ncbi:MAG: aminopeptidase P family protein [Gammaproteobacteria bacterium]|nr:aminopeptidase P family protein [Gammaproteobacteria bacterium]